MGTMRKNGIVAGLCHNLGSQVLKVRMLQMASEQTRFHNKRDRRVFQFRQMPTYVVFHVRHLRQLFSSNAAPVVGIGLDEAAIYRRVVAFYESGLPAARHDLFKQLFEQFRLLEPSVPVPGERGVVRNLPDRSPDR